MAKKPYSTINLAHTLIKQLTIHMNGTLIRPQTDTYVYEAYLETLLNYDQREANSLLGDWFPGYSDGKNELDFATPLTANNTDDEFPARVKAKPSKEERESGGGESDLSETEKLVEELIVLSEESEKRNEDQSEAKREDMANEKKQALEMRDRALERLGETRKRNEEEKEEEKQTVTKKRRSSGGETLEWLRDRAAVDTEMKEREMKEKREERETQKKYIKEMEAMRQQQNEQVKLMQQQMLHLVQQQQQYQQQQQQQQQQQFALLQQQVIAMSQQQQQQSQALLAFLQRKN
ncbi:uncharacterized protein [Montipora capricornis]|uniref:uncharacterized protein n=2 Tax=Montipora capricornis TaxID=246305 RepID=UPI0035F1B932